MAILLGGQVIQNLQRHQRFQKLRCDLIIQIAGHFHSAGITVLYPFSRILVTELIDHKAGHLLTLCFLHQIAGFFSAVLVLQYCRFGLGDQIPHPQQLRKPAGGHIALGQVEALAFLQRIPEVTFHCSLR